MKRISLLLVICVWAQLILLAQDAPRWMSIDDTLRVDHLLTLAWQNPAINQFSRSSGVSHAGGGIDIHSEDGETVALDVQRGDYSRLWNLMADTHIKHHGSTLWGHARYENGFTKHITWNETSDMDIVYPYLLADSVISSRMKTERYSFGGGYADNNGRLYWGASIDYTAGLHYRSVDPRPRNITACLDFAAGVGVKVINSHVAALSLGFRKYKQTNNVAFYSELGHDKIFHLTGLTNDYGRFAGTGEATYYNGYRWRASVNLHPIFARGLTASVELSRFAFDNILTGLNKLPLARVTHNAVNGEIGWLQRNWGVRATVTASRRVGTENVFGDAAAMVYPLIGSNDMYHENRLDVGLDALWSRMWTRSFKTDVHPLVSYRHLNEIYADPQCRRLINQVEWGTRLYSRWHSGRFMPRLMMGVILDHPVTSQWLANGVKEELAGLMRAHRASFDFMSHFHWHGEAMLSIQVAVNNRQAIRLNCGAKLGHYYSGLKTIDMAGSLNYVF